jgi:hypothetical protein
MLPAAIVFVISGMIGFSGPAVGSVVAWPRVEWGWRRRVPVPASR